jgi:hypothetical protein
MTRGERLLFGRVATWMGGVRSGYSAKTADPSTSLRYGRDDKGREVTFRKSGDLDGRRLERLREDCRSLRFASVGREVTFRKSGDLDGGVRSGYAKAADPYTTLSQVIAAWA